MTHDRTCRFIWRSAPLALAPLLAAFAAAAHAVTIHTTPVGNAGNAGDPTVMTTDFTSGYGAVAYNYRIATTEVTNSQYAEFLNAKAASDPLALYNTFMGSSVRGGITQSGVSGSFTYAAKTDMGNKPVNYVTWYDSIRFANWLNNGQGSGDTETGAYTILGGTATPSNGLSITRNSGAIWFMPSEDEWFKAAYYQPTEEGGDVDNYWRYPTASNTAPTIATAINLVGPTRGDIGNPGTNVANYSYGADWNSANGNVTTVGSAGPSSTSFYGTFDQGGNVSELNETLVDGLFVVRRGGGWDNSGGGGMLPSQRILATPGNENESIGFRVATVPEPSSFVLAALGLIGLVVWKRRRR